MDKQIAKLQNDIKLDREEITCHEIAGRFARVNYVTSRIRWAQDCIDAIEHQEKLRKVHYASA